MPSLRKKVRDSASALLDDSPTDEGEELAETQVVDPEPDTTDQPFRLSDLEPQGDGAPGDTVDQGFRLSDLEQQEEPEPEPRPDNPPIDQELIRTVQEQETGGVPEDERDTVLGDEGASVGRAQIQPTTAVQPGFGVEPLAETEEEAREKLMDPEINEQFQTEYLKGLKDEFETTRRALIAWQWGPGKTRTWIENGAKQDEIPSVVKERVDEIAPVAERASRNLEQAGVPVNEAGVLAEATEGEADPEAKLQAAVEEGQSDYDWSAPWESGLHDLVSSVGGGLEMIEGQADAIRSRITALQKSAAEAVGAPEEVKEFAEFTEEMSDTLTPFDRMGEFIGSYASSFGPEPGERNPPLEFDNPLDYVRPKNLNTVLGRTVPTTLGIGAAALVNTPAAVALTYAVEGGHYMEELERAEAQGADISEAEKLAGGALVAGTNSALEMIGIGRILKAFKVPGVRNKILQTLASSATEGATEFAQELTAMSAKDFQAFGENNFAGGLKALWDLNRSRLENISEEEWRRLGHAAYAGATVGLGLGGVGAGLESVVSRGRPDAEYVSIRYDDDGNPVPQFEILREEPQLDGPVSRQTLEDNNLKVPEYRVPMMREVWKDEYKRAGYESDRAETIVEANMALLDQRAQKKGVSLERLFEEERISAQRTGQLTEERLEQFAGTKADWLQTERRGLERAKELEEQGFGEDTIYNTTGWFRNPNDSKWRMEVPAHNMEFNESFVAENKSSLKPRFKNLDDFVDTDHKIFELYPELEDVRIRLEDGRGGSFTRAEATNEKNPKTDIGVISLGARGNWKKTFWHELQHAIQYIEGFARGASANDMSLLKEFNSEARDIVDEMERLGERQFDIRDPEGEGSMSEFFEIEERMRELKRRLDEIFADQGGADSAIHEAYRNVAGEIEARVAANRNFMRRTFGDDVETTPAKEAAKGTTGAVPGEAPQETLERETSEDMPIVARMYDNPVRSQLRAEGYSPLLQDDPAQGAKGVFEKTRDGRTLIRILENADESTLPHEISHLFRRTLTQEEQRAIEDELGIQEWNRQEEEKFADAFEQWLGEGGGQEMNEGADQVMAQFEEWMAHVYSDVSLNENTDVDMTDGVRSFFYNLFEQRVQTEEGRSWMQRYITDKVDIEGRFARIGQPRTGRMVKIRESTKVLEEHEGMALFQEITRLLGGDREAMTNAVLAAESDAVMESIENEDVIDAAERLRGYFEKKKEQYQQYGRMPKGFHERLASELREVQEKAQEEMESLFSKGDEQAIQEQQEKLFRIADKLEQVEDLNFVHIPVGAWFGSMKLKNTNAMERILDLAIDKERQSISIQDLLENDQIPLSREDISLRDVLFSYSRQVGNDISLLRLREAARAEGAAVKGSHPDMQPAPDAARAFDGFSVNKPLQAWLSSMTESRKRSRFKEWINLSKMFAFWNPTFLPTYDVIQGAMIGSFNPLRPIGTTKHIMNAVKDVVQMSEDFMEAGRNGIASQPFSAPMEQTEKDFIRRYHTGKAQSKAGTVLGGLLGRVMGDIDYIARGPSGMNFAKQQSDVHEETAGQRALLSGPIQSESAAAKAFNVPTRAFGAIYEMSWDSAWFLDRTIRQVTYRHLKDEKGLDPEEAAQMAATVHGDYASVPQETRSTANAIFFTPTFKAAMGKFLAKSLRGVGEVATGRADQKSRIYAGAIARSIGIMTAYDAVMISSLGFEREEFGRSYCRPAELRTGKKQFCVSWSTPFNLFSKYAKRVWDTWNDPTTFHAAPAIVNRFRWELTPLYRITMELWTNQSVAGDPIYNELDPPSTKAWKALKYYGLQTAALFRNFSDHQFGQEGKRVARGEFGKVQSFIITKFVFPYTSAPEEQQFRRDMEYLMQVMNEEVALNQVTQMMRQGATDEEIEDFVAGREERQEQFMSRMDALMEKYRPVFQEGIEEPPPEGSREVQEQEEGFRLDDLQQQ